MNIPLTALAVAAAAALGTPSPSSADPLPVEDNACVDVTVSPVPPRSICVPWGSPLPDPGCVIANDRLQVCT